MTHDTRRYELEDETLYFLRSLKQTADQTISLLNKYHRVEIAREVLFAVGQSIHEYLMNTKELS